MEVHTARLCTILHDSINACSRIQKNKVQLCASLNSTNLQNTFYHLYFNDIWYLKAIRENEEIIIKLSRVSSDLKDNTQRIFQYRKLQEGTLLLEKIFKSSEDD